MKRGTHPYLCHHQQDQQNTWLPPAQPHDRQEEDKGRAPNFLPFKGVPSPPPWFFSRGYFYPLFKNFEGIAVLRLRKWHTHTHTHSDTDTHTHTHTTEWQSFVLGTHWHGLCFFVVYQCRFWKFDLMRNFIFPSWLEVHTDTVTECTENTCYLFMLKVM